MCFTYRNITVSFGSLWLLNELKLLILLVKSEVLWIHLSFFFSFLNILLSGVVDLIVYNCVHYLMAVS